MPENALKIGKIIEWLEKEKSTDVYDCQWIILVLLLVILMSNFT